MKRSIGTRLLIITLAASIVGMGLIAAASVVLSATSLRQESMGKIIGNTAREAVRINGWIENQTKYITAFANDLAYQSDYSTEALLPALDAHLSANAQYFDVYMGHPDGTGSFASGWVPDYAGGWTSYKRGWYAGAAENTNAPFITSLYTDAQTGSLCITVSQAVVKGGSLAGVAAADMFIDVLTTIVNETDIGADSYAFLTDASGNILIHPNKSYGPDKDDNFQNLTEIENGLYKNLWNNTTSNGNPLAFQSKDGVTRYYTSHRIDATGWRLYTTIPAYVVNEPIYRLLYFIVPIFIVILLLAALLIYMTIRRQILRPINSITRAAEELAAGNTDIQLEGAYRCELLLLRDSFLKMAESTRSQVESTSELAAGNLTISVTERSDSDVMGNALNRLSQNLNSIMSGVYSASERVSAGSELISNHSQMLAQGATEQAAAVQQLSTSINEISNKIRSSQEKTVQASQVSDQIYQNVKTGMELMENMVAAVTEINDASSSISKVIKAIEDIAFQTNILALNAAVEAARAGQHGKGFAVVADEVRNLASKSAAAANESAGLIRNSIDKASDGARIARETSQALETVISGISESTALIGEISAAAGDEYAAITYINEGIGQVSQVVNSNAATSEEAAAAAQELSNEAQTLRSTVSRFRLGEPSAIDRPLPAARTATGFSVGGSGGKY